MRKLTMGREEMKALSAALRKVNFFADLSMRDLERVFNVTNLYAFDGRRTTLFKKDDLGDALYIIYKGTVDILLPRFLLPARCVARLGAGDVFGEMALIDQTLRTASAVARGPAELFVLLKPSFDDIVDGNPDFALTLKRVAAKRAFEVINKFGG